MEETLASIDVAYKANKEQIEAAMFDLALEGIANGRMDYSKDPILPHIVETINKTVIRFNAISKEDQEKMVALTEEQKQTIRNADNRALDEFITTEPKIDGSLRNNSTVSKVLSTWGN
jgi:phage-related tail protein